MCLCVHGWEETIAGWSSLRHSLTYSAKGWNYILCFLFVVYTKKTIVWKTEHIMILEASLYPDEDEDGFLQRKKKMNFFLIMKENLIMI